ncbi:MAG: hypothetical protein QW220_02485 [Candidatus Bathyarchaeia archaeon]
MSSLHGGLELQGYRIRLSGRPVDASHVSVWRWVKELEGIRLDAKPRRRKVVALDETG